ncbi:NAD-dependent epimerase/dehydratase family protein [Microbacterium aurum]
MSPSRIGGVLVTGGAGFIGRALSRRAASGASRWVALDVLNPRIHESPGRPGGLAPEAELVVGDITSPADWDRVLADFHPDVVVHLAAETDTGLSLDHPTRFTRVNLDGTAVMLEALSRHGVVPRQVVVASSRAVYGEGEWRTSATGEVGSRPLRTQLQLERAEWDFAGAAPVASTAGRTRENPTNIYGVSKHGQEGILAAWCGARGAALTVLRLQNVYGPGQSLINPYTGILALFVRTAAGGSAIPVFEDGRMLRDFVHIDDVAAAFARAIDPALALPENTCLDIGTGRPESVLEIARAISRAYDAPDPVITGQFRNGDIRHAWCSVDDAERVLGWRAAVAWEDGVADYARWYIDREVPV